MKKMMFLAIVALLSASFSISTASARERRDFRQGSPYVIYTENKIEPVFHVKPFQFRRAENIFKKKYPAHELSSWKYDSDGQRYSNGCRKPETDEEVIYLILEMNGNVKTVERSSDREKDIKKKIGLWDKK